MIANERQYRITKRWLERFEQARTGVEQEGGDLQPRARKALRDQYESQIEELREQLAEYDALRDGRITVLDVESLAELPEALIRARIAVGLTQRALAERLGLKEQQIQRYEATRYAGVSFDRLNAVADAMGVSVQERILLPLAQSQHAHDSAAEG